MAKKSNKDPNSKIPFQEFRKLSETLDLDSAKHILLSVKKVFDENNIPFLLVFGTLLGAYRDKSFIKWDSDIDIALYRPEDVDKVVKLINDGWFIDYGVEFIRKDLDLLISLSYKTDYIDIYFFEEKETQYRCGNHHIEKSQIDLESTTVNFLGEDFKTVNNVEKYLAEKYGSNWRTPIRGKHATT